jgi:iron(III) transport system permease protein
VTTPAVDQLAPPTGEQAVRPKPAKTPAPSWLWAAGLIVVLPALIPVVALMWRVLGASSAAWDTLVSVRTAQLLARSIMFASVVTAAASAVGVAAAWITTRTDIRYARVWSTLLALPLVVPSYVLALAFISFAGPRGLFADLAGFGLPGVSGFWGAVLVLTLATYPYVYLVVRSSIVRIDPALEEAARGLGSGAWEAFRRVTLPQLRPSIAASSLLVALYTLSDFGAVSLMRLDVFTRVIYAQYQGRLDRTPAAVLSIVLMAIAITILWAESRSRGRSVYFSTKTTRPPSRLTLTRPQRRGAYTFLMATVGLGLALPVLVLVAWLGRGLVGGAVIDMRWGAVAGSLAGASVAGLLAMAAAIPVAILTIRHQGRASRALRATVYAIFSLPHIAVALAVVFFASRFLGGLYQSFTLLVLVYATLFLAQASGATEAALAQVNPNLEEAARGLGDARPAVFRRITLPLIRRGLLAGGALVFLTSMKELPATLLLRPTGFDTLAVRVWSTANDLFYARAAAPALLLLIVSAVPMYYLVIRPRQRI